MNHTEWTVHVEGFDGPLDLLLHLIKELKIDIFDIPMVDITEQYLHYLQSMKELQLDVAGDYLVMAATLLEIKSRMLLPKKEIEVDEDYYEEAIDPREELVQQLLEYKRIQEAAKLLKEMEEERGDFFTKLPSDLEAYRQQIPLVPGEVETADLLVALSSMMRRLKKNRPLQLRVEQEQLSVEQTMVAILERFRSLKSEKVVRLPFTSFFVDPSRTQIVTTFLAMLELVKERQVRFMQEELYGEIVLESLERVEE